MAIYKQEGDQVGRAKRSLMNQDKMTNYLQSIIWELKLSCRTLGEHNHPLSSHQFHRVGLTLIFDDWGYGFTYHLQQSAPIFFRSKALFTGCSRVAHWSKSQACKRPPERTGSLGEHWAPKWELFARRSSSWSLGRGGQQAGRQAEVGGCLRAGGGEMFIQNKSKGGQQTNHGVGLLKGWIREVSTGLPGEKERC